MIPSSPTIFCIVLVSSANQCQCPAHAVHCTLYTEYRTTYQRRSAHDACIGVNQVTCCWHFDWLFFIYLLFIFVLLLFFAAVAAATAAAVAAREWMLLDVFRVLLLLLFFCVCFRALFFCLLRNHKAQEWQFRITFHRLALFLSATTKARTRSPVLHDEVTKLHFIADVYTEEAISV